MRDSPQWKPIYKGKMKTESGQIFFVCVWVASSLLYKPGASSAETSLFTSP